MKWFKHDTDAHRSEGLTALQAKLGLGALGRWWVLLEIIAEKMDSTDKCSVEYPVRWWCEKLQYSPRELWDFLKTCEQHCKILVETSPELDASLTRTESKLQSNSIALKHELIRVLVPNLLKKRDEYHEKSRQTPSQIKKEDKEIDTNPKASGAHTREAASEPPVPPGLLPSVASGQKPERNGKWQPPPEIILLANDLLGAAGIGDRQDRKDIAYGVLHAVKAGNEEQVHRLIGELKAGEFNNVNNLTAAIRARLKVLRE